MPQDRKEVEDLLKKYKDRLEGELKGQTPKEIAQKSVKSKEYIQFKKDILPAHLSVYEKFCNFAESALKIKADPKRAVILKENLETCHLNATPDGVVSLSMLAMIGGVLMGIPFLLNNSTIFVGFFFILLGLVLYPILDKLPDFFANSWRMKASNQMILSVFYVVTYMRHTSNLENAIEFAAEHIGPPLSLDFKKVLWDVETERYESVKESLDNYLESWRKYNMEFIEAMQLIESSLYESSEDRRIGSLEKALSTILDETYEKMLHYAQELKNPITTLNMLGVILPILGLVILPLVVNFMGGGIKWYHIALLYDIVLPLMVLYLGKSILATRPTGYGDSDISELNPEVKKYENIIIPFGESEIVLSPLIIGIILGTIILLIGFSPLMIHALFPKDIPISKDANGADILLLDYKQDKMNNNAMVGPFGMVPGLMSLLIPLGVAIAIAFYFRHKSQNIVKIREQTKTLEKEFAGALFQLGNRLGDGLPAEIAFERVADTMKGTVSGGFFDIVNTNIRKLGYGVQEAVFNEKVGAIIYYPSNVIESSMKVLIESSKKGPYIASQALINVSQYIKQIHQVNERLKDLLSEIISSMKSQVSFLTPVIAGIVVGITSMITTILGNVSSQMDKISSGEETGLTGAGSAGINNMFGLGIPMFYFQIIVGIYVVELAYILIIIANGIENGADKLGEEYALGENLLKSFLLYAVMTFVITLVFNFIALQVMNSF